MKKAKRQVLRSPGGRIENSPAFQRWVWTQQGPSPEGTAEPEPDTSKFSRPFGTYHSVRLNPPLKRWAIVARAFGALFLLGCLATLPSGAAEPTPSQLQFFENRIRPVLVRGIL